MNFPLMLDIMLILTLIVLIDYFTRPLVTIICVLFVNIHQMRTQDISLPLNYHTALIHFQKRLVQTKARPPPKIHLSPENSYYDQVGRD